MDNTHMVPQLPPLEPGETEVTSGMTPLIAPAPGPAAFAPPAIRPRVSLAAMAGPTMRVNITTMRQDHSLEQRQVDLALAQDPIAGGNTWTTKMRTVYHPNGQVTQTEASCKDGRLQCQGDARWCADQEKVVCGLDSWTAAMGLAANVGSIKEADEAAEVAKEAERATEAAEAVAAEEAEKVEQAEKTAEAEKEKKALAAEAKQTAENREAGLQRRLRKLQNHDAYIAQTNDIVDAAKAAEAQSQGKTVPGQKSWLARIMSWWHGA